VFYLDLILILDSTDFTEIRVDSGWIPRRWTVE